MPHDDFLERASTWLANNAPDFENERETITKSPPLDAVAQNEVIARARAWEARKAEAGFAGIALPSELGGAGLSMYEEMAFASLESHYRLPYDVMIVTKGMVLPTILRWGSEAQKRRFIPPAVTGSQLWCQMFSEPGAGSDLAAISTRATEVDGGWQLDGQKVWTSYGADADWGYVLARTDPDVQKHQGLTAFLLDMRTPGVDARPLRQATGGSTFAEIFLDGAFVPADCLLGGPGDGWRVALTTLMNERVSIDATAVPWKYLHRLIKSLPERLDERARDEAMQIYAMRMVLELVAAEGMSALREQREPGPEGSATKIIATRAAERSALLANRLLGGGALEDGPWQEFYLGVQGLKMGGGSEDILKTVIGERVLGLPQEPRMDRGMTWSELKSMGRLS